MKELEARIQEKGVVGRSETHRNDWKASVGSIVWAEWKRAKGILWQRPK
jgi:hypothetical protein